MSADQTRRILNQLENEIAALTKKSAEFQKKEAVAMENAEKITKSINSGTSLSTIKSKQSQISRYKNEAIKAASLKADIDKKIADKRKRHADTMLKLQREESNEEKKRQQIEANKQKIYEKRINSLSEQLLTQTLLSNKLNIYSAIDDEEYDVFISYASEDKEGFVNNLVEILNRQGIKVWFDDTCISWGDSLRSKIDTGLRKSKFGIVIISNSYIRKGWTQYELDGLFQQEMTGGKIILPLWHKISKDEVQAFSPSLAGRKALNTSMLSAEEIADELTKILKSTN